MSFGRLRSIEKAGFIFNWSFGPHELIQDIGERCLNKQVGQETKAEWDRDEWEEVKVRVELVCPDALFQIENSEFHEDTVAKENPVSQTSVGRPVSMAHKSRERGNCLVLQDQRHDHKSEPNNVDWSWGNKISKTPSKWPSLWVPIDDFVESHDHELEGGSKDHASDGNVIVLLDDFVHTLDSRFLADVASRIFIRGVVWVLVLEPKVWASK